MKAIVYTSQTGHTQRYAQMLAERTGVPAYSLKEAGKSLRRGEEIFYMGWLMAGTVKEMCIRDRPPPGALRLSGS